MSAAPKIILADLQAWRQGFLNLRPSVVPCPGLTMQSWAGVHEKCVDFLDRWADEAAALGWTTLDLFGVHPEAVLIRSDYCGGIVMSGDKVSALTANRIAFVNTAHYRDTPGRPKGAVPIWLFRRYRTVRYATIVRLQALVRSRGGILPVSERATQP